jgi:hypothetical protein
MPVASHTPRTRLSDTENVRLPFIQLYKTLFPHKILSFGGGKRAVVARLRATLKTEDQLGIRWVSIRSPQIHF